MQKIKNIIFDLGGVILNIDNQAVPDNIEKKGFDARQILGNQNVKRLLLDYETGRVDTDSFRLSMKSLSGMTDLDDEEFDRIWCSILLDFPDDRIKTILNLRQEYRIFLLSNTNKLHYDRFSADFMSSYGLPFDSLFEHVFYSFEMGLAKPDKAIFASLLDTLAIDPKETLYIDDTPANTAVGAQFGIQTLTIEPNSGFGKLMLLLGK